MQDASRSGAPLPYPNIAYSKTLAHGTLTVRADGGHSIAVNGSQFRTSIGDEPGVAGGVKSGTHMQEATWLSYSPSVRIEGRNACRLTDKMLMNHGNTVNCAGLLQIYLPRDPEMNLLCNVFCDTRRTNEKVKEAQEKLKSAKTAQDKAKYQQVLDEYKDYIGKNGQFNNSKYAKDLAGSSKFAKHFKKLGFVPESKLLVPLKKARDLAEKAGRKLYTAQAVLERLEKKAKQKALGMVTKKLGQKVATKVVTKFIPGINLLSLAWDIYDAVDLAMAAKDFVDQAVKKGLEDFVEVRPDIAKIGGDGSVQGIYDYKFEGDRPRAGQYEIYTEATGRRPTTVNLKACNYCKEAV